MGIIFRVKSEDDIVFAYPGIMGLDFRYERKIKKYRKRVEEEGLLSPKELMERTETKDVKEFQDIFVDIRGKFSDIISDFESFPIFKDHAISYFPSKE